MTHQQSTFSRRALLQMAVHLDKDAAIGKILPPTKEFEPDSLTVVWDIVLDRG